MKLTSIYNRTVVEIELGWLQIEQSYQQFRTVSSGPSPGPNVTIAKLTVTVVNNYEPSTWVRFDSTPPSRLTWAGRERVTQRVHL